MPSIQRTRQTGQGQSVEYSTHSAAGDRHYEARVVQGSQAEIFVIVRDITEKIESEKSIDEIEKKLQDAQRLESLGRMASGIAHDFNNVMSVVVGMSTLLGEMDLCPEAKSMVNDIRDAATRGSALTKPLVAFARPVAAGAGSVSLRDEIFAFRRVLASSMGESIALVLDLPDNLWFASISAEQLHQLLLNLAINARDAMPQGGVFRISARNIDANADFVDERVSLEIADTGIGMNEVVRSRIFEPFFTTKPRGRGTGLGLTTVYGIVHRCGGEISVESAPNQGTSFFIRLPKSVKKPVSYQPQVKLKGSELILLVEDDPVVLAVHKKFLLNAGYQVITAQNGEEGLSHLSQGQKPAAVISDVSMPVMGGLAFAGQLQQKYKELPIMFVSAYAADESLVEAYGPLLLKPVEPQYFLKTLRLILEP